MDEDYVRQKIKELEDEIWHEVKICADLIDHELGSSSTPPHNYVGGRMDGLIQSCEMVTEMKRFLFGGVHAI